jgi:hypothetical protein
MARVDAEESDKGEAATEGAATPDGEAPAAGTDGSAAPEGSAPPATTDGEAPSTDGDSALPDES